MDDKNFGRFSQSNLRALYHHQRLSNTMGMPDLVDDLHRVCESSSTKLAVGRIQKTQIVDDFLFLMKNRTFLMKNRNFFVIKKCTVIKFSRARARPRVKHSRKRKDQSDAPLRRTIWSQNGVKTAKSIENELYTIRTVRRNVP